MEEVRVRGEFLPCVRLNPLGNFKLGLHNKHTHTEGEGAKVIILAFLKKEVFSVNTFRSHNHHK